MDTFASIALSTTLGWPPQNNRHRPATPPSHQPRSIEQSAERPAKRARSEKLPSPAWVRAQSNTASRPATSYESVADSRTVEAELLLNFSHSARFSVTSATCQSHPYLSGENYPVTDFSRAEQPSFQIQTPDSWVRPSSHDLRDQPDRKDVDMLQQYFGPISDASVLSSKSSAENLRANYPPETLPYGFHHQLIEASNLGQQSTTTQVAEFIQSSTSLPQPQPGETDFSAVQEHPDSYVSLHKQNSLPDECSDSPMDGMIVSKVSTAPAEQEERESLLKASSVLQEQQDMTYKYWPSMLATTVEQSMSAAHKRSPHMLKEQESSHQQSTPDTDAPQYTDLGLIKATHVPEPAICAACNFTRNSISAETDTESTSWISCDGCKSWFHFACAGFKSEREVRAVDKYRCRSCKKIYGPTTFVRKSARAHTAIDYAGLNQGVIKTSDERPEHHYIKPIKDGTINIQPEHFARMRPEIVTAEHFEKGNGMKEPIVIPAEFNPRPRPAGFSDPYCHNPPQSTGDPTTPEDWFARDPECRNVLDHGQDALDMVIPHNLTVRKVAELYGPDEKIEVIDVKSQNGEGKKWNMRRWADYYENASKKIVRNVISLEVSRSTLGRLIRRPQIVRDLDLQDSVWPAELQAKGEFPRVQFYCLMSVADCFTDFHIDFGGSSVFYHILKGKKTFFFIPPKEKHLKKYEEWCMSPAQNWTFLGDQTKECYRVDLSEGDTMLIPAGWIHAVWTPEDSLVIGGNFLTRLNYSMQLRIAQVEKATGVARKFRYPHFQKIQWYTAIRYLESDPLPASVRTALEAGGLFHRQYPAYHDFNTWGENSRNGRENYHARYYSQPELEGLPDLIRYLLRTALIDSGEITEGISADARNAVRKSIPRGFGEPLEIVKSFAFWCAWKRGNESIPHWAHADAVRDKGVPESAAKLSGAALKKLECEARLQAPRRHSARNQVQQAFSPSKEPTSSLEMRNTDSDVQVDEPGSSQANHPEPLPNKLTISNPTLFVDEGTQAHLGTPIAKGSQRGKSASGPGTGSQRKTACETCRRRRRACRHKTDPQSQTPSVPHVTPSVVDNEESTNSPLTITTKAPSEANSSHLISIQTIPNTEPISCQQPIPVVTITSQPQPTTDESLEDRVTKTTLQDSLQDADVNTSAQEAEHPQATQNGQKTVDQKSSTTPQGRGRSKACGECRKSKASCPIQSTRMTRLILFKRRCLHDEHGQEDPVKVRDAAHAPASKRRKLEGHSQDTQVRLESDNSEVPQHAVPFMYSMPSTITTPHQEDRDSAPTDVVIADDGSVNVGASRQLPFTTFYTPPAVRQTDDCTDHSGKAPRSPEIAEIRIENPSSESNSKPDADISHDIAQGSANGEARDNMQQTTTTPPDTFKYEMPVAVMDSGGSFERPAASSLVSPPASSRDDSERPNAAADPEPILSASSSRHSSQHAMQTQRITPESGPTRRDSSSSVVVHTVAAVGKSPSTSSPTSPGQAPDSAQKRMKARLHSETVADEENLRLIRALQAQDYGLRRRGRAA